MQIAIYFAKLILFFKKKLEKKLKEKKIDFSPIELQEFCELIFEKKFNPADKATSTISEVQWRNNLHSYYVFEKRKFNCSLLKKINLIDLTLLPKLDEYFERLDKIFKKGFERNVTKLKLKIP